MRPGRPTIPVFLTTEERATLEQWSRRPTTAQALAQRARIVHLILDNWLAKRPRFHVHFTPTGGSWLNLVERWFGLLTDKQIKRGVHLTVRALEATILQYITLTNNAPRPFVWTKTADEILASVARFCQRISGTGH